LIALNAYGLVNVIFSLSPCYCTIYMTKSTVFKTRSYSNVSRARRNWRSYILRSGYRFDHSCSSVAILFLFNPHFISPRAKAVFLAWGIRIGTLTVEIGIRGCKVFINPCSCCLRNGFRNKRLVSASITPTSTTCFLSSLRNWLWAKAHFSSCCFASVALALNISTLAISCFGGMIRFCRSIAAVSSTSTWLRRSFRVDHGGAGR